MEFVVCCPVSSADHSNGVIAMIRLSSVLNEVGFKSRICVLAPHPHEDLPISMTMLSREAAKPDNDGVRNFLISINREIATHSITDIFDPDLEALPQDCVVVYPEVISGNPLGGEKIVRMLGNRDGMLSGQKVADGTDDSEFYLSHSKLVHPSAHHYLFFAEQNPLFSLEGAIPISHRVMDLTYIGKGELYANHHSIIKGSVEITRMWPQHKNQLAALLKSTRFLFTYDSYSNLNVEAVLSGVVPVLLGGDKWTADEIDGGELGKLPVLRADELDLTNPSMPDGFLDHYNDLRKQLIQRINKYNEQYPRDVAMFGRKCSEFFWDQAAA